MSRVAGQLTETERLRFGGDGNAAEQNGDQEPLGRDSQHWWDCRKSEGKADESETHPRDVRDGRSGFSNRSANPGRAGFCAFRAYEMSNQ